jgi:ribonuclease J
MTTMSADQRVRLVPLGGLGEFGLNSLLVDYAGERLLVDAGMLFAGAEMPGIDSIVPDYEALREGRLHGILLTHGHEDHIGALFFALQVRSVPVYGTPLTLGLVARRLRERGQSGDLRPFTPGQSVELGPFRVHPIRVAHSIVDSVALAIETPAGTLLHSGDFKIDPNAPADQQTDVEALAQWGQRGVLALLSDSTNVEASGPSASEDDVLPAFEQIFERTRGRVLVSCFATSIPRIQRVADVAARHARSVAFVGRRMADNAEVAQELGLLRLPAAGQISAGSAASYPPRSLALFVAGSQGEPLSALATIARGEHKDLSVGPGDTVVLSARVVPGNERVVSRLISNLYRRGCDVVHPGVARVHVSGHGQRDDLITLLQLVRPQYLIPIHGEYRMLAQHAALARLAELPHERVHVLEDGDVLALGPEGAQREARVPAGRVLLDRSGLDGIEELVVRDRRQLAVDGIVVPIIVIDKQTGRVESPPEIVSRGFVDHDQRSELMDDAGRVLLQAIETRSAEERADPALTRERVRAELRRFLKRRTQRRPMVIPVVLEV